jgi:hypothetical protein
LSTKPTQTETTVKVKQTCNGCQKEFNMCELRDHLYSCSAGLNDESDTSDDNATKSNENIHNGEEININLDYVTPSNNDFGFTDATLPLDNTNNEQVSEITGSSISRNDLQIENQPITVLDQQEMDDDIQVISVNSVVDYLIMSMKQSLLMISITLLRTW